MKIIIAGAGEVGTHLAKLLSREDQDIVLIDSDAQKLNWIDANYNLMTVTGSPTSFKVLKQAGISNADLFIAVMPFESRNITACTLAAKLGAKKTVARIDNYEYLQPEYRKFFKQMGVDELIYPEMLAAQEILTALRRTWARNWFEMYNGELILISIRLRENASILGLKLSDLTREESFYHISAIKRNNETIIPRGNDVLQLNDIVYFTTTPNRISDLRILTGKAEVDVRKVMIMGGSRIAVRTADILPDYMRIKLIEIDKEKSLRLVEKMNKTIIINGDARDTDLLKEESISDVDAFVALTDSSETNILACLSAKRFGVKKTVAEVENISFIATAEGLNIGSVINKKLLAASRIFQILLDSDDSNLKCLSLADAEVAEIVVRPGAKITHGPVKKISFPPDLTIGGLIRDGKGYIVNGDTCIQANDHVVVFCLDTAIRKLEKLFY